MYVLKELLAAVVENPALCRAGIMASADVRLNYLILFNARSGSTWLTKKLSGAFGQPDEHLNPQHIAGVAAAVGTVDPRQLIHSLRGHTATHGIFGTEATSSHLEIFGEDLFFSEIPNLKVFHLFRDDICRQAISLYRAVSTEHFHSTVGPGDRPDKIEIPEILHWLKHLVGEENKNVDLCIRRGLSPVNLTYETIIRDEQKTISIFREALGSVENLPQSDQVNLASVSDGWNDWAVNVFLRAVPDEIGEIEASRKVKQLGWKSQLD